MAKKNYTHLPEKPREESQERYDMTGLWKRKEKEKKKLSRQSVNLK